MSVGFNGNLFGVMPDGDSRLPFPIPGQGGVLTYSCTVILASRTVYNALKALRCDVTILPAMGGGALIVAESGPGKKSLVYPYTGDDEITSNAILTEISALPRMLDNSYWQADLTFVLVS